MAFLQEPEPPRGVKLPVLPGISRIVARNPSVMTYHGTNTYLIEAADGLTVLDPGPDDAQHVRDILALAGAPLRRILLSHAHGDHYGAVAALKTATGLPVHGYKTSGSLKFSPDVPLDDGDTVAGLQAVYTPGHAPDHLCFAYTLPDGQKILFSGDHVMSWSSSIVSPPEGDMLAYYRSLELLLGRDEVYYLGGHGPILPEPRRLVRELLSHRQYREGTIVKEITSGPDSVAALAAKLYDKTNIYLKVAAQRNVLAHLLKLQAEGIAVELAPATEMPPGAAEIVPPPGEVKAEGGGEIELLIHDALRRFGLAKTR